MCQDLFQHAPEQYTLFIFPDNEHATVDEGLPNCLQHAVFMPPHARVQRLKDEIANAIERPLLPRQDPPFNRLRVALIAPAGRSATRKPKSFTRSVLA